MARILIACCGSYGDINPYVGLALGLRARGHCPVIAAPPWTREYIERAGVAHAPLRLSVEGGAMAVAAEFVEAILGGLRDSYEDLHALAPAFDLIVTHPATLAGPIVAEQLGLRWVSSVVAPLSLYSIHDTLLLVPPRWLKDLPPGADTFGAVMVRLVRKTTQASAEPIYAFRSELGLPRGGNPFLEGQHSPRRVLALFARVLAAPQPDWPANVTVTGPILYNANTDQPLPANLSDFLAGGEPPIVFTLGSSRVYTAGSFYEESARACEALGRRGVLLVGRPENRLRDLPPGLIAVEEAPHALLFRHADAVVHHAGIGTLTQALYAGRPMLTVPFGYDQPDNARRAVRLGVARALPSHEYRAELVASELRILLEDPTYAERSAVVAAAITAEDGVGAASRAIEAELRN